MFYKFNRITSPSFIILDVEKNCNLKCKTCFVKKTKAHLNHTHVPLKKYFILFEQLHKIGTKKIVLTGLGEPLLRADISDIMYAIKKNNLMGALLTNGTLLNREIIKKMINIKWDELVVSIDGPSARYNDKIRGAGTFTNIIRNLKILNRIKKEKNFLIPDIHINIVITNVNYKVLHRMIFLAKKYGVTKVIYLNFIPVNPSLVLNEQQKVVAIKNLEKAIHIASKFGIHTNASFIKNVINNQKLRRRHLCFAPWRYCVVSFNGDVYSCCQRQNKMGNINKESIFSIWNNKKYKQLREKFKDKEGIKCGYCAPADDILNIAIKDFLNNNFLNFLSNIKSLHEFGFI
jgi:MoaA/NifB/PqqE/SkfB family radical SAM enzyme